METELFVLSHLLLRVKWGEALPWEAWREGGRED